MSGRLLDAVPLSSLTGVGAAQSSKLAKIGLHTVTGSAAAPAFTLRKIAPIFTR